MTFHLCFAFEIVLKFYHDIIGIVATFTFKLVSSRFVTTLLVQWMIIEKIVTS